jgi:putative membrane protein
MKNLAFLALGIIVFLLAQACQNSHPKNYSLTNIDSADQKFIKTAIEGGLTEIKASGLAITNSNNQKVISLAKMMITDHTNADSVLVKMENDKMVQGKDTISTGHQQMINTMSKQNGAAFDKAYLAAMIADHEAAVDLFTTAGKSTDADVSKFATQTLPIIKMHLESARSVLANLK